MANISMMQDLEVAVHIRSTLEGYKYTLLRKEVDPARRAQLKAELDEMREESKMSLQDNPELLKKILTEYAAEVRRYAKGAVQ